MFPTSGGQPNYHFLDLCKRIAYRAELNCGNCDKGDHSCGDGPCCDNWYLHKFRSTFATMHLQAGVDLRTVQQWMGHKDLASTMRIDRKLCSFNADPGRRYDLSFSVGIVPNDATQHSNLEQLLSQADALMYRQKHSKKDSRVFLTSSR